MKTIYLTIGGVLALSGCASFTPKNGVSYDLTGFIREQEIRANALSSVEGKLQIRYQIKGQSLSGNARMAIENEKSRLEVSDPVGTLRYWFVANQEEATAFYQDDKTAYLSNDGGKSYLRKMFSLELNAQELNGLWMGILPTKWRNRIQSSWDLEEEGYHGKIQIEDQLVDFWVNSENGLLTQLSWDRSGKRIKLKINDFDACCFFEGRQSVLGHHVVLSLPEQTGQIVLDWIELNRSQEKQNPLRFEKTLPKGTQLIQLKK